MLYLPVTYTSTHYLHITGSTISEDNWPTELNITLILLCENSLCYILWLAIAYCAKSWTANNSGYTLNWIVRHYENSTGTVCDVSNMISDKLR